MLVFTSLKAALDAGFAIYDRTSYGYLVRTRTPKGLALAIVDLKVR